MRSLVFLIREFLSSLKQSKFLHLTYGAQVTVSLLVLGIFCVLLFGALVIWSRLGEEMKIHVYLQDGLDASANLHLENQIETIGHVESVRYRSKEEALEVFQESQRIPLGDLVETNPLPASYIVQVDQPRNIDEVAATIEELQGVWIVKYNSQIVDRYIKILMIAGSVCAVTIALLLVFTFSSISNIIGLTIYARRTEIRIMQLVGATWWFIRWPFLFEGVFVGAMGALVALVLIWGLMLMMAQLLKISQLGMIVPGIGYSLGTLIGSLGIVLLAVGVLIGFFGSLKVVNTFLGEENRIRLEALKVKELVG